MSESFAKKKASEILLKVCYFPFVAVGGIAVSFYDVAQMEKHPVMVFALVVGLLHVALLAFWVLVFRRLLANALEQLSFSKATASAGLLVAYVMGLFIGWLVHRYA
jgi:hypothetical protein